MKKRCLCLVLLLGMTAIVFAQTPLTLEQSIQQGVQDIESRLKQGVKVVALNFNSPAERFSNYVLDELIVGLVNGGKLVVVDRQNLDLIRQEMDFQMSGEVSDASAQAIGAKLGAQSIISGSLEDMGNSYRIRFKTIEVESAAIQAITSLNVEKNAQMGVLLSGASASSNSGRKTTTVTATGLPHGLNYTTGDKVGRGFLNMIFGVGSFSMGDLAGGFITAGIEVIGIGFIVLSTIPETEEKNGTGMYERTTYPYTWAMPIASLVMIGGFTYGFFRPFTYDVALARKNGTYQASSNPLDHINIALIPDKDGIQGVQMTYSIQF